MVNTGMLRDVGLFMIKKIRDLPPSLPPPMLVVVVVVVVIVYLSIITRCISPIKGCTCSTIERGGDVHSLVGL